MQSSFMKNLSNTFQHRNLLSNSKTKTFYYLKLRFGTILQFVINNFKTLMVSLNIVLESLTTKTIS